MSNLFDKLVESAGQAISGMDKGGQIQSAISGLRQRLAEADRRRKLTLLKQQVQDLQTREAQAINALSAQVLALHEAGSLAQPELLSLCRGVDDIRAQIREREAELAQLQPPVPTAPAGGVAAVPETGSVLAGAKESRSCRHCGAVALAGATFCQACGTRLAEPGPEPGAGAAPVPPPRFCIQCGAQLRESARFCPMCGQVVGGK